MGIKTTITREWVCDGCGKEDEANLDFIPTWVDPKHFDYDEHRLDAMPNNQWAEISVTAPHCTRTKALLCPSCAQTITRNKGGDIKSLLAAISRVLPFRPIVTVDALVTKGTGFDRKILLIRRKNPPAGWALPGGLVDYGETVEAAVVRELKEETNLVASVGKVKLFCVSSDPGRDPRFHSVSLAYQICDFTGEPQAADDAAASGWFTYEEVIGLDIAFDHGQIINDFWATMTLPVQGLYR